MFRCFTAVALAALGACSFSGGASGAGDGGSGDDAGNTDIDAAGDAAVDAPVEALCKPATGAPAACWELENNLDDSVHANHGTGVNAPGFSDDGFEGAALALDGVDQAVTIPESQDLDAAAITVEARIFPEALPPSNEERGVFDNQGQWSIFLADGDRLRCVGAGGPTIDSDSGEIETGTWYHVACTVDATRIRMFLNGDEIACGVRDDSPARTTGDDGSVIGADLDASGNPSTDFFDGLIDSVRVFEEARTPAQICAAAGGTDCREITDPQDCEGNQQGGGGG